MTDLIDRLSTAAEGPRELDVAICKALPGPMKLAQGPDGARWPDYTTSVDAALTLIPEDYYVFEAEQNKNGPQWMFLLRKREAGHPDTDCEGVADTPALALCTAALKARAND